MGVSVRGLKNVSDVQLLIFDPATYGPDLRRSLLAGRRGWHSMIKRGLHTLRKPEYQFVVPDPDASFDDSYPMRPVEEVFYI